MRGSLAGIMPGMKMGMRVMVRGKMTMIKTLIKAWTSMNFFISYRYLAAMEDNH